MLPCPLDKFTKCARLYAMNDPFDPQAYAHDVEKAASADGWTIRHLSPTASGPRPWFHRAAKANFTAPHVYFSAGIHGDEISGPLALLQVLRDPHFFADFNVTIFPILNPNGLLKSLRENADGLDLNRDYRTLKSDEIQSHVAILKTLGRFDAAMMLHEDYEGIGAYLFELNDMLPPTLGGKIIAAMGRHVPIDQRPEIDDFPAHGGVLLRKDILALRGPIDDRPDWAEAVYLSVHHTQVSYTTETPKPFPLEQRIAAQVAAMEVLLNAFKNKTQT
jgi:murein peptide amidase A